MSAPVVMLFLFGILWAGKGPRFAFCILPAMVFFFLVEALIWGSLIPDSYPGDFLDMVLPLATIPIGVLLSIPLLVTAVFVARKTFAFANRRLGPQKPLPVFSPARLPGLLMAIFAVGLLLLG